MTAKALVDISVDRSCAYDSGPFTFRDGSNALVNFTGATAKLQVRSTYDAASPVLTLTQTLADAGQIVLGGALGTIQIKVTRAGVDAIPAGSYLYDLIVTPSGSDPVKYFQGAFVVQPTVTQ